MLGRRRAAEVLARYGVPDLEAIVIGEGLEVVELDRRAGRLQEVFVTPAIFLPRQAGLSQRRTLVAHCLGHHFLHAGNQMWFSRFNRIWSWKQERQADEFVAWLTIPDSAEAMVRSLSSWELAA